MSARSTVLSVAAVGLALAGLRVLASSIRVLVWVLIAASVAGLLYPVVDRLARRLPRGIAVALVMVAFVASVAGVTYRLVDEVVAQAGTLEREAPRLAEEVERNGPFAEAAREADLSERAMAFVDDVPERLRGGTPADALRSAATRGLSFLAVSVLTLFFLLHGPKLAAGAARQIHDDGVRARVGTIAAAVYARALGYARGSVVMAAVAGAVTYGLAVAASVPGPAPLALWVVLWDAVPLLGAVIGALPIVILAAVIDPAKGATLAAAVIGYQLFEALVLQTRLERATVNVGPFLTVAAGFAGLEMYGLAGALLSMLAVVVLAVVLDESASASAGSP